MKKYRDKDGKRVVEVSDLSYLTDRNHRYNWFQRHYHHHRLRRALKKAVRIVAADKTVAYDIHRFYFIQKEIIDIKH
jgi:hypothetical protein